MSKTPAGAIITHLAMAEFDKKIPGGRMIAESEEAYAKRLAQQRQKKK